jgi:hypothetical protein
METLIALRRAVAAGIRAYREAGARPDLRDESDYDREIQAIWEDFQSYKQRRERARDEAIQRESARVAGLGSAPGDPAAAHAALEETRRSAQEEIMQKGREAQRRAYALEREKNRRFRLRRYWREMWK